MNYRWPLREGDRVAIAPHHDLWMAGCRWATVREASRRYARVTLDTGRVVVLDNEDLLGAVSRNPVQHVAPDRK